MLALTEMQEMICSSVNEFLVHEYSFAQRAASLEAPGALAPGVWQSFADMGWLGLPLSEDDGGIGGGAMESGLLMRAFGRHLVVEPFIASVLLGTRLLAAGANPALREKWLPLLIDGSARVVLAHDEALLRDPWRARRTRASAHGNGYRLDGAKSIVAGAPGADALLVTAQLDDGSEGLFIVPANAQGVTLSPCRTLDGAHAADLRLDGVLLDGDARLACDVTGLLAEAVVSQCWEASGAMQAALEQTAAYVNERMQFGQAIGKFQVVQHRLAEMAVCCEEALAACQLAALRIDSDPSSASAMAALVKSKVARGAQVVAREAVQLHGAMGVSEELAIASYFRKLLAFSQQGEDAGGASQRYGALMLAGGGYRASRTLLTGKGA
ncbi:MAG: acyl-CoA dehydrogenase family protein [Pseudomonadota bacterium]